ncbi:hypothetical protein ABBQ38_006134 [Trebouxia sp. C0009 RCD-2024]
MLFQIPFFNNIQATPLVVRTLLHSLKGCCDCLSGQRSEFHDFQTIVDVKIDRPVHGHQLKHPYYLAGSLGSSIPFGSYLRRLATTDTWLFPGDVTTRLQKRPSEFVETCLRSPCRLAGALPAPASGQKYCRDRPKYAQDTITMAHKGHLQAAKLISDVEDKVQTFQEVNKELKQEASKKDVLLDTEKSARHTAEAEAAALQGQLQALERQKQQQQQLEAARQAETTSTHAAQVLALEKQQQVLEAKLVQKTEELQAATAQKAELAKQVQALTNSVEARCALAVHASEQKLRRLQNAHAHEAAASHRQRANFWQEASKALAVLKVPNLSMAAGDNTKHLTKKSAENQREQEMLHANQCLAKPPQEARDAETAEVKAQLASSRQESGEACPEITEVTEAGTPADDMIQRLTKKAAKASEQEGAGLRTEAQQGGKAQQMQAELQSQAEQKTALKLKQKNAEQEASNVQTPKEGLMIKAGVRQELDSLSPAPSAAASLAAASGSGGSGARGSSLTYQAPQPTPVPLPPGLNKDREQRQGNVFARLSGVGQRMGHPPAHLTDQWVFKASGVHRGPITKAALLSFLRRKQLPPGTPVLHYPQPAEGPRQAWFLVDCAQAWTPWPSTAGGRPEDYAVMWDEHAA